MSVDGMLPGRIVWAWVCGRPMRGEISKVEDCRVFVNVQGMTYPLATTASSLYPTETDCLRANTDTRIEALERRVAVLERLAATDRA